MKKLATYLAGGLTVLGAASLLHCSGGDPRPEAGNVDKSADSGVDTGTPASDGGAPIEVTPLEVSFGDNGLVNCGAQGQPATITLRNRNNTARTFNAKLTTGSEFYTLNPDTLSVLANDVGTIQVVPKAIPTKSAVTPELYSGTVDISASEQVAGGSTTTAPTSVTVASVRLHQTARGAIVKSTLAAGQPVAFGGVKVATTSNQTFSVTNTGNAAINLGFAVGSASFGVTPTATLDPNGTKVQTLSFSPAATQAYNDTLVTSNTNSAPLCDELPGSSTLSGTGTQAVGVSPGNLGFGLVNCGSTAAFKLVTISSSVAMNFTPTLGKGAGSAFTLADSTGAALPLGVPKAVTAGVDFVVRVVPKAVTAPVTTAQDGLADTLTITTDAPNDVPHVVQLTETAQGAYLSLDAPNYNVIDGLGSHAKFTNITVKNTGNLPINAYTIAVVPKGGAPGGTFALNGNGGALAALTDTKVYTLTTTTPAKPPWCDPDGGVSQYLADINVAITNAAAICSDAQPTAPVSLSCQ